MHKTTIRFLTIAVLSVSIATGTMAPVVHGYNIEISKELEEAEKRQSEEEAAKGKVKAEEEAKARQAQEAEKATQERAAEEQRKVQQGVEAREREAIEKANAEKERTMTAAEEKPSCVVPNLKRKSLGKARVILRQHHCRLGKVTWAHPHDRGRAAGR